MTTSRPTWPSRVLALAMLLTAGPALAGGGSWSSSQSPFGTVVSNGQQSFFAPDEKAGRQMARALNKAEKKAERADDDGAGEGGGQDGGGESRD